jgi:hypothetical protein
VVTFEEAPPAARSVYNKPGTLFTVHIQPCGTADARCLDLTDLSQYQPLTQPAAGVQNGGQQANGDGGHAAEDRSVRAFFELAIAQKALERSEIKKN